MGTLLAVALANLKEERNGRDRCRVTGFPFENIFYCPAFPSINKRLLSLTLSLSLSLSLSLYLSLSPWAFTRLTRRLCCQENDTGQSVSVNLQLRWGPLTVLYLSLSPHLEVYSRGKPNIQLSLFLISFSAENPINCPLSL